MRRSTGAGSATPAAAATAPCTAATRSARCSSSAAGRTIRGEREQWALRDVAPVVLEHFGLSDAASARGASRPARLPPCRSPCCCSRPRPAPRRPARSAQSRRLGSPNRDAKVVEERREERGADAQRQRWSTGTGRSGTSPATRRWRWSSSIRATGSVRESWTGYQVAWKMARGYSGAFGHKLNAPYVFLPLCALFLVGLLDWRRPWRVASLDLLVLLGFGVSNWFFNRARDRRLGPAPVPGAALPAGPGAVDRPARARRGDPPGLAGGLAAGRRPLSGRASGSASTSPTRARSTSATRGWSAPTGSPTANRSTATSPTTSPRATPTAPSTTSPTSPSRRIWPWHGSWDDLPAAHAAAVFFDLATFALLILLGLRIRPGPPAASSPRPSPSAGPPTPTPPTRSSRTPTTPSWRRCWSRPCSSSPAPPPAAPCWPWRP